MLFRKCGVYVKYCHCFVASVRFEAVYNHDRGMQYISYEHLVRILKSEKLRIYGPKYQHLGVLEQHRNQQSA